MSRFENITVWEQGIGILLVLVGAGFAWWQLRIASTAALLQSEVMIFDGLRHIDDATADLHALMTASTATDEDKKNAEIRVNAALGKQRGAIQNYLNSLDRYCSCVLRRIVSERRARKEYRSVIAESFNYKAQLPEFNFEEHFPNISELRKKWNL